MVSLGQLAPEAEVRFTDKESINKPVDLQDIYSKHPTTVLYFFPAAFTGVCTRSSCELRDTLSQYKTKETGVYGISVDMPFTLKKFGEINEINYPLLSDWNKIAIEAFNIVDNDFANGLSGVSKRALFAVKDGGIIFKWVAEHPEQYPPFADLMEILNV